MYKGQHRSLTQVKHRKWDSAIKAQIIWNLFFSKQNYSDAKNTAVSQKQISQGPKKLA